MYPVDVKELLSLLHRDRNDIRGVLGKQTRTSKRGRLKVELVPLDWRPFVLKLRIKGLIKKEERREERRTGWPIPSTKMYCLPSQKKEETNPGFLTQWVSLDSAGLSSLGASASTGALGVFEPFATLVSLEGLGSLIDLGAFSGLAFIEGGPTLKGYGTIGFPFLKIFI